LLSSSPSNLSEVLHYLDHSNAQGNAEAKYLYRTLVEQGIGVAASETAAMELYRVGQVSIRARVADRRWRRATSTPRIYTERCSRRG
jgi:TPR repeat protein